MLIAAEQKKALAERIVILNDRITNLEAMINDFKWMDSVTVATYETQIKELNDQKAILEKLLKKEKRKRFWTGMIGIASTAGAFFIGCGVLK